MGTTTFNAMEIDAIGEIMNISIGASATAVSTMLGTTTNITTPIVSVETRSQFSFKDLEPAIGVEISYVKGLSGRNVMMFSRDDVRVIVGMMMGQEIPPEEFEMDEMNASAIREVMNQMMGSSATALSEFLGTPVDISTPISFEVDNEQNFKDKYFPGDDPRVIVKFNLEIENKLNSEFLNIMPSTMIERLLAPFKEQFGLSDDTGSDTSTSGEAPETIVVDTPETAPADQGVPGNMPLNQSAIDALLHGGDAGASDTAAPAGGDSGPLSQAAIDALMNGGDSTPAPAASGGPLDQAAVDALLHGGDSGASATPASSSGPLDQAAVDALLHGGDSAPAPAPAGGSGKLDQAAVDALLHGGDSAPAPAPATSSGKLDQSAVDALLHGGAQEAASPFPSEPAGSAPAAGQPAAQPQMGTPAQGGYPQGYPQMPYGGYVQPVVQQAGPDPATLQILQQMQQSQNAMLELIKEMKTDEKTELEALKNRTPREPSIVHPMNSQEFTSENEGIGEEQENKEMLMKVPLEISVEIGRTKKLVKDILEFTQGSLVVLDKMAGEQADLYVNGECIARGDIVVVEDNFGIRITEILNKDINAESL